jgi:hypothetical protein
MPTLTRYDNNLIANLLTDRANFCTRNAIASRELQAYATADYWTEQQKIASDLAIRFRTAGQ